MSAAEKYTLFPACDVDLESLKRLVKETHDLPRVGGYKIGFRLALEHGLKTTVAAIRAVTDKPIVYDHQKAATDIPDTGSLFAQVCRKAGVDTVILFPLTGPNVLKAWVEASLGEGLKVQVGGYMTHPGFLADEEGFLREEAPKEIYFQAADLGVTSFVVPGNRADFSWSLYDDLKSRGIQPTFFSPGIGKQGGDWRLLQKDSGPPWHVYVGRSVTQAKNMREATNAFFLD